MTQANTPTSDEREKTADILCELKDSILELWKKQIQVELPAARGHSKHALEDHMPDIIEQMAITLRLGVHSGTTEEQNELSKKHARQRADLGNYTLEEVLEEYRIAREIIILELNKKTHLSAQCQCLVNRILDRAIVEAGVEFADIAQLRAEEAQARAEIANQSKSDFLANMSHEIRTPLGAVLGFTELMRDPNLSIVERMEFADIVNKNGRQLSTLINDILDISKIEAGHLHVEEISISLVAVVTEVTTLLRETAFAKGLLFSLEIARGIPDFVLSDPTRLAQILTNLIGNAVKFTPSGSVTVALEKIPHFGPDFYAFVVTDTGIGISNENRARLFQSFTQADSSTNRKYGGTGLGLFLSKRLAIALGGNVVLDENRPQSGCRFVATFRAPECLTGARAKPVLRADTKTKPRLQNVRILLAEDSLDNQTLVTRYLRAEGAIVQTSNNGIEVLEAVERASFDVILMDIQMPILDGYETSKRLRLSGFKKPILALTANAMAEEKTKAFSVGCDAHLTKPINRQELILAIESFITAETPF